MKNLWNSKLQGIFIFSALAGIVILVIFKGGMHFSLYAFTFLLSVLSIGNFALNEKVLWKQKSVAILFLVLLGSFLIYSLYGVQKTLIHYVIASSVAAIAGGVALSIKKRAVK